MKREDLLAFARGLASAKKSHMVYYHVNDDRTIVIEGCEPIRGIDDTLIRFEHFDGSREEPDVTTEEVLEAVNEYLKSA